MRNNKLFFLLMTFSCLFVLSTTAQRDNAHWFNLYADSSAALRTRFSIIEWKGSNLPPFKIVRQLNDNTAIVYNDKIVRRENDHITRIAPANNSWKLSPSIEKNFPAASAEFLLTGQDIDALYNSLTNLGPQLVVTEKNNYAIRIKANGSFVKDKILALDEVIFIDKFIPAKTETAIIGYDRTFSGINTLDYLLPGADGKGITAGVKEQRMESADLDLYKRVLVSALADASISNHATVVSSIIGGAGNSFYDGRGIAHGCKFYSSSFDNLFPDDINTLNNNTVSVQNHSYGTIVQSFYGAEAAAYDAQLWSNKKILHVFSAGNRGLGAAPTGSFANLPGFANLTGNFKMAKNIISVAAIDNKGNVAQESSAGPAFDGRLTPQLAALGPNGTSDAAAMVTGTIAVMQQVYADSNAQQLPDASLIKAILYNSADDIYTKGVDFKTGYGLLNSYEAVRTIQQKKYESAALAATGQSWLKMLTVPPNAAALKITLSWTDIAAPLNINRALINDLDLELRDITSGVVYHPWVLSSSPFADSLKKEAVRKRDSLNTSEQVSITLPAPGNYEIRVKATSISGLPVPFHLAINVDTLNTFHFTSPQHASDLNREENQFATVKWKTFVADTNQTANLKISYDAGLNWETIAPAYKLSRRQFQWAIKDTNSQAQLKMETSFGDFFSSKFIIAKLTRPLVDFLCADSLRISWNKHIYGNSYKIYALTDSPYLKHVHTVADSFVVMNRNQFPYSVYAIEPVLQNNLPAARSIAIDVNFQGVQCFYRTFYYSLADGNNLNLVLELSSPVYVDSIYFEHTTADGQVLKRVGSQVASAAFLYEQVVIGLSTGTTYWRAGIKLRSGAIVYTNVVEVLSSGKRYILFYPNPVDRNSPNHILQQGIGTDAKLILYDMMGRQLKSFSTIPDRFNFTSLPPGLVVYRLFSYKNELLETGKLLLK